MTVIYYPSFMMILNLTSKATKNSEDLLDCREIKRVKTAESSA